MCRGLTVGFSRDNHAAWHTPQYRSPPHSPKTAGGFAATLDEVVTDDDLVATIKLGLFAMMETRSGKVVPDWSARATFVQLALAYKVGKPSERRGPKADGRTNTIVEMIEHARASPEYRASIVATLKGILAGS